LNSKAIIMHLTDDVATALTDLEAGEKIVASLEGRSEETVLQEDIQFAHKYALRDIAKGEPILKYGMPIGKALEDIPAGKWVHVHNCRSERFGFHREQYGLKA
jgi:hypothetical protein